MTRASSFLKLCEGFKLGSLGVSRKPKVTPETPVEKPKPLPREKFQILEVDVGDTFIMWSQTIEEKWLRWFNNYKKEDLENILQTCYLYFELTPEDRHNGLFKEWFPQLHGMIKRKDTKLVIGDFEYKSTQFSSRTMSLVGSWIVAHEQPIRKKGLAELSFPDYWVEMYL
jgi:hypothetical protein